MKKVVIEVFLLIAIAVISSIIIYDRFGKTEKIVLTEDEIKFKQEYEVLNGKKDRNGNKYVEVKAPENNGVVYTNVKEIEKLLQEGTCVIYLGTDELNYSRSIIEPLFSSKDSTGVENIYYLSMTGIRDDKNLDGEEIIIDSEGTNDYKKLLKLLNDYLPVYDGLNDNSIKRIYLPAVIFVVDGEIRDVEIVTTDEEENKVLSSKEKNELATTYMKYMAEVSSGVCDDKC